MYIMINKISFFILFICCPYNLIIFMTNIANLRTKVYDNYDNASKYVDSNTAIACFESEYLSAL